MRQQVGLLLLGLAVLLLAPQQASAGFCFPSLVDMLAAKSVILDKKTVFGVLTDKGSPLNMAKAALCPGSNYKVHLEFPDPRTYFVTGTKGFFGGLLPSLACPNQWSNNNTSPVTSIDLPFTIGCNVKGLSVFGIASVLKSDMMFPFNKFQFLNISMPVLDLLSCPTSFCANTTTGGSLRDVPAYGQCGGAGGECAKYGYCDDRSFPGYRCTSGWTCQRQHRWYYQCLPGTVLDQLSSCDFSVFGEPMATMLKGLGVMCEIKSNLMTFALSSAVVPKMIDPFAMLQLFNGLTALKATAVPIDVLSLITTLKTLCLQVPTTNSTQAVMVSGMSQFLSVFTSKLMPASNNNAQLATAAINVLSTMGSAAYSGSYADLSKSFSLDSMLGMVNSFATMMSMAKTLGLMS